MMKFLEKTGKEARDYAEQLATLRLTVFWEYPYLYEGTLAYEKQYLETYFRSAHSYIFLIEDKGEIVGATTGILASEEEESFRKPFADYGLDPETVFYFGESVLLANYRSKGLGKVFFHEREKYARSIPKVKYLAFCAVERLTDHHLKPMHYRPLDEFWKKLGFHKVPGLTTNYTWKDRDKSIETTKKMQFWLKKIEEN